MSSEDSEVRTHHTIIVEYKCPMEGCGLKQEAEWSSHNFPTALEGISIGDIVEGGRLGCPDCENRGVAHSDRFEVTDVNGEPVNTDYDPLVTDGGIEQHRPYTPRLAPRVSYSTSHGTKRVYVTRGYREKGLMFGFNTRWGGRCLWIRGGNHGW